MKTITVLCLLVLAIPALAKDDDKSRTFNAPYEQVWEACIASAGENFVIEHSEKDSGMLTFRTGISVTSAGFTVGVVLKREDDKRVSVRLNPQAKGLGNWGAGGRIAKKFFKGVDQFLKDGKAKV